MDHRRCRWRQPAPRLPIVCSEAHSNARYPSRCGHRLYHAFVAFPSHSVCCLCMAFQQCFARSFRLSSPCVHRTIISPICLILLPPSPTSSQTQPPPPPPPTPPPPLSSHPFPFSPFQHFGSLADLVMSQYSKVQTPTITELSEANHTCPSSISVLRAHHAHRPQLHCPLHQLLHYI